MKRITSHSAGAARRRGMMSMEVVLATVVAMGFAMGMFLLAQQASSRLYEFISTMVGSPYL